MLLARNCSQERSSYDVNDGAVPPCPIFAEWFGSITSNARDNEERIVIEKVGDAYVDTWVNVLFINEYTVDNMLNDILCDSHA